MPSGNQQEIIKELSFEFQDDSEVVKIPIKAINSRSKAKPERIKRRYIT
jgi:hypothetical protein